MAVNTVIFEEMKTFIGFGERDVDNLRELAPIFDRHGGKMTDQFYEVLARTPATAKQIEGRVDALKATHGRWMGELFAGDYGDAYFESRMRIGNTHVRIGLAQQWVEGVMNHLRTAGQEIIYGEVADVHRAAELVGSYLRILDLDLMLINDAFANQKLDQNLARLASFTGMSRKLLENCIKQG